MQELAEVNEPLRHAANSCRKDWCFLIFGNTAPASVLPAAIMAYFLV